MTHETRIGILTAEALVSWLSMNSGERLSERFPRDIYADFPLCVYDKYHKDEKKYAILQIKKTYMMTIIDIYLPIIIKSA